MSAGETVVTTELSIIKGSYIPTYWRAADDWAVSVAREGAAFAVAAMHVWRAAGSRRPAPFVLADDRLRAGGASAANAPAWILAGLSGRTTHIAACLRHRAAVASDADRTEIAADVSATRIEGRATDPSAKMKRRHATLSAPVTDSTVATVAGAYRLTGWATNIPWLTPARGAAH